MAGIESEFSPLTLVEINDACYEHCELSGNCDLGRVGEIVYEVSELGNIDGSYFKVTCDGPDFTRFRKQLICRRMIEAVVRRPELES
jgi:hypothetical protein